MDAIVGRHGEALKLSAAYERATSSSVSVECVLISGNSGTGKTSLAHSLRSLVFRDKGLFLSGKNELDKLHEPFVAFASAFSVIADAFEESNNESKSQLERTRKAVRDNLSCGEGRYIRNVIPSVEFLTGPFVETFDDSTTGINTTQLFHSAFCKLVHALTTVAPLVVFLDDLQWSDTSTLKLVQALLALKPKNPNGGFGLLLIMAYRDENVYISDSKTDVEKGMDLPFLSFLPNVMQNSKSKSAGPNITEIHLESLNEHSINEIVANFLNLPMASTAELGRIVFATSGGNPFFALQVLQMLIASGHIVRDNEHENSWKWFDRDIVTAIDSTQTVDDFVRQKLLLFPKLSQEVFQVAACLGDEIDESAIAIVIGKDIPEFEMHIQAAQGEGFVEFQRHLGRFRFSHDRIRQAVLSTIKDQDGMMFRVGYALWTRASVLFLAQKMFLIASLINYGKDTMTDQSERYRAAALNLEAGIKAASISAYPESSRFLAAGIEFLRGGDYWNDQYDLSLNLFSTAADTAVCVQDFDYVAKLADEVLKHGMTELDKLRVYAAKINAIGQRGMLHDAIEYGVGVLQLLGQPLPQKATVASVVYEVVRTKCALRGLSDDDLLMMPPMSDSTVLAAIHIMNILIVYSYQAAANFFPLLGARVVRMFLKHGYHKTCALGLASYAGLVAGTGNRKEAYRLGCLALERIKKDRAKEMIPRVHATFYGFINHWLHPLRTSLEPLAAAEKLGMQNGDFEFAMMALNFKCTAAMSCGMPLKQVEEMMVDAREKMVMYKQETMLQTISMSIQFLQNMTGRADDRMLLVGDAFGVYNPCMSSRVNWVCYHYLSASLAFFFGDIKRALHFSKERQTCPFKPASLYLYTMIRQMDALIAVASARLDHGNRRYACKVGKRVVKEMRGWARDCPENFFHRQQLLEAEFLSLRRSKGVDRRIHEKYKNSVALGLRQGFLAEAAGFCELMGNYVDRQGDPALARKYWQDAYDMYLEWGGTERAKYLSERNRIAPKSANNAMELVT